MCKKCDKEKFYITTAIAYTSRKPHIGNSYEIVMTDAIAIYIDYLRKPSYTVFCLDYSGSMSGEGVDELRNAYNSFSQKVSEQSQKHKDLVNEYDKETAELDKLGNTLGTTSKEYQDQKAKVEDLAKEVAKSTKNEDENTRALAKKGTELNNAEKEFKALISVSIAFWTSNPEKYVATKTPITEIPVATAPLTFNLCSSVKVF